MYTVYYIYSFLTKSIIYVGWTEKIDLRIYTHFNGLSRGNHINILLQKHVDFFGEDDIYIGRFLQHRCSIYTSETEKYFIDLYNPMCNRARYNVTFTYTGNYETDMANIRKGQKLIFERDRGRQREKYLLNKEILEKFKITTLKTTI